MIIAGPQRRVGNRLAIAAVLAAILVVTLFPDGSESGSFSFAIGVTRRSFSDAILNFLLFLPLGLAIGWGDRSAMVAVLSGLLVSSTIECVQTAVPGRSAALADIIFNSFGALSGALIARRRHDWIDPTARTSRILTAASLGVAVAVIATTAYLLSPSRLVPRELSGELQMPASQGEAWRAGGSLLMAKVPFARDPVLIARSGNDLLLRYPSRADGYGFDQPEYWATDALTGIVSGERVPVSAARDRGRWEIEVGTRVVTLGPTVGQGWAALAYPDEIGRHWGRVVSAAWLAAIFLPAGFWSRARFRVLAASIIIGLLAFFPAVAGIAGTTPFEWAGALTGFLAGAALRESRTERVRRWIREAFTRPPTQFERAPERSD